MKREKDPLDFDFKEVTKTAIKGAITLGITLPILLGITKIIGGNK
jgi:hypothetical protein